MKTIILSTLLATTLASFTLHRETAYLTTEPARMASQIEAALRQTSAIQYTGMLPSLEEFHRMMDKHAAIYGDFISEAKTEFDKAYQLEIVPSAYTSFERVLEEGNKRGIAWDKIQVKKTEVAMPGIQQAGVHTLIITFTDQQKEFQLQLDNVLEVSGTWRVSPFIRMK